jgi:PAS domain S-box-containing protein
MKLSPSSTWIARVRSDPRALFVTCLILDAVMLAIDFTLPAGYAIGTLYIGPMLLAFWLPWRRAIIILAVVGSICVVAGYVISPDSPTYGSWETILNRVLAILVIWWATGLALAHQTAAAALRQSEEGLRTSEARLRSILETVPSALVTIDEKGVVESFSRSAEALFGYRAEEVVGRNVGLLMPSPHREQHDEYIERYLRTGERRIIGIGRAAEGRRKDGAIFPIELSVGEAHVGKQRIFIGFVRDLTARQKVEQELRQAQKMEAVGQLTGGIAHDFNNLLTVILGNLEMLRSRLKGAQQRELLEEAHEAANLAAQLTERLLAFGRRQALSPKRTDVSKLVRELGDLLRRVLGENIEVVLRFDGMNAEALVDPSQLQNALLNLAINARDAMPTGGKLVIELSEATLDADYAQAHPEVRIGRYLALAVTDTGIGMSKEVQERAFEPFFTTKSAGTGTGLGLSMVYGFVKQSAGHVQLYSEPGHGSTIRIYLPLAGEGAEPELQDEARLPRAKGETILVVEDDPRVRRVTVARLRELGYAVTEADSGPAAIEILASRPKLDLVFTDVVMPGGLTGFDVAEQARAEQAGVKVLFTSGYAEPEIIRRGQGENARWIRKPYTRADLARKLREVLDERETTMTLDRMAPKP